jgi:hypothetical protein
MRALKHCAGVTSIAITLDYFLFNGYCTNVPGFLLQSAYKNPLKDFPNSERI